MDSKNVQIDQNPYNFKLQFIVSDFASKNFGEFRRLNQNYQWDCMNHTAYAAVFSPTTCCSAPLYLRRVVGVLSECYPNIRTTSCCRGAVRVLSNPNLALWQHRDQSTTCRETTSGCTEQHPGSMKLWRGAATCRLFQSSQNKRHVAAPTYDVSLQCCLCARC